MRAALELHSFRRLALGYTVNAIGNWLAGIALVLLVYGTTGNAFAVVALMVAGQLVPALFAPALVSRFETRRTRRVLPLLHLLEAGLLATLALLGPTVPLAIVIAVVFADGVLGLAARTLVKAAVVTTMQPRGLLREANAVLNVAFTVSLAAGPALAGWLSATVGIEFVLLLDSLSFVAAAAALSSAPDPAPAVDGGRCLSHVRAGLTYVRGQLFLRRLVLADTACTVLFAMILPIEVVYLTDTLHSGPAALGAVLTAWGAGSIAGSLLMARLSRVPVQLILLAGMLMMVAAYLGMAAAGSVAVVVCFSALGGIGNGMEAFSSLTVVQLITADRFQVRVNGLVESVHAGAPGVGFVLGGIIAATASPRAVYFVAGAGALAVVTWAVRVLRAQTWPQATPVRAQTTTVKPTPATRAWSPAV